MYGSTIYMELEHVNSVWNKNVLLFLRDGMGRRNKDIHDFL